MAVLSRSFVLASTLFAFACAQQGASPSSSPVAPTPSFSISASTPNSATIRFGMDQVGSPFPPDSGHDQSGHARDTLVPGTVVIDQGGTVTFEVGFVHQVAIYAPGKEPEDVNTSALRFDGCFGVPLIDDSVDRVNVPWTQPCAGGPTSPTFTFTTPGRYLVICTFLPHFEIKMYGWVIVRDR